MEQIVTFGPLSPTTLTSIHNLLCSYQVMGIKTLRFWELLAREIFPQIRKRVSEVQSLMFQE